MAEWSILPNYLKDSFINSFPPNIFYSRNKSYEKRFTFLSAMSLESQRFRKSWNTNRSPMKSCTLLPCFLFFLCYPSWLSELPVISWAKESTSLSPHALWHSQFVLTSLWTKNKCESSSLSSKWDVKLRSWPLVIIRKIPWHFLQEQDH